ncbi:ras guanine nucleotide exchange factor A-like [Schistocerca gregaria]|uniref:ras guanine nucleotide exchange factor A-like n=1 Tax=Schistocerca gregaria TaxID=7010 RepID=UPI00211EC8C4|nr:ras guanine nucleotide exchange factor A-like [Schistocerca gregaria]
MSHTIGDSIDSSADTSENYSSGASKDGHSEDDSKTGAALSELDSVTSASRSRSKGFSISRGSLKIAGRHKLSQKVSSNSKETGEKASKPEVKQDASKLLAHQSSPRDLGSRSDTQVSKLLDLVDKETYIMNESEESGSQELHAATLETLIFLLPFFKTQEIKAFLYTYRAVCTPTKLLSLICEAWETCDQNLADSNTLQAYRLRTFNVLRTWVMMYTQDFDADMFCRLRQFVASIPSSQYSESTKNYMMEKIDQRFSAWKQDKSYRKESDAVFEVLKAFGKRGVTNEHSHSITSRVLRQSAEAGQRSVGKDVQLAPLASYNRMGGAGQNRELDIKTRNSMAATYSSATKTQTLGGTLSQPLEKQDVPLSKKQRHPRSGSNSAPLKSRLSLGSSSSKKATIVDKKPHIMSYLEDLVTAISPKSFAEQLTLVNHSVYKCITPSECINQAWARENGRYHALHILRCIDLFNILSVWVTNLVISIPSVDQRAVALNWVIKLGFHLHELRNYHSLTAVIAACESAPIARLKKTWSAVEPSSIKMLESFKQTINSEGSFKKLRQLMKTGAMPIMPYIGIYLGDLTFIEDGNPEIIDHNGKPFVNFTKMKLLARVIDDIVLYQMEDYKIEYDPHVISLLEDEFSMEFPSDKELYEKSLRHEPREE